MALENDGPVVARGSLAITEREQRARLAAAEEASELARVRAAVRSDDERLALALKTLRDLRRSRGYRLMRRLGRWESVERGMRRVLK